MNSTPRLGATPDGSGTTEFVVWAPLCERVEVEIVHPVPQRVELMADAHHYFRGRAHVTAGARYFVIPNGGERRPDPASRYQPEGVHGPSEAVDRHFEWTDRTWEGRPLRDYIIYELHVGTFTSAGTFDAVIEHLDYLKALGVTAIEIMPVAQFPGERNWGYDGVLPFAVQNSYGGPAGLKRLVDACHAQGLAIILDVVYNHFGPEGNYIGEFAPFFTHKYRTPWGAAVNVDGEHSDGVRAYFIENAVEWITDFHFDALRLDAVHSILDTSARPFLAELSAAVHACARTVSRAVYLIAESDLNDVRMLRPTSEGGMGMDAQWLDDFHHSLHALLTGEDGGYYSDYGSLHHFATSLRSGYVYTGTYSEFRKRRHGNAPVGARAEQFVVCLQNHDQVGNRMRGDRITHLTNFESLKLGAACVLLSPYVPMLFMGEEYGEEKPFPFFIHHSDQRVIQAVRHGRKEEFSAFGWNAEPPDPQSEATFRSATVDPDVGDEHTDLFGVYHRLIELRKQHSLGPGPNEQRDVVELDAHAAVVLLRQDSVVVFAFSESPEKAAVPLPRGEWRKAFCSADQEWRGPGASISDMLTSPGSVCIDLPARSASLFLAVENR